MKNETALGHVLTLMTIIIWGTTFVSTKVLLEAFTPIEILFFRFTLGYLSLWGHLSAQGHIRHAAAGAALRGGGAVRGNALFPAGKHRADLYVRVQRGGHHFDRTVLHRISGELAAGRRTAAETLFRRVRRRADGHYPHRFERRTSSSSSNPVGDILATLAAVVWACYSILMKKIGAFRMNMVFCTRKVFFYGLLFMLPALFIFDCRLGLERFVSPVNTLNLLYLGFGASALCFVTWNWAVRILGAVKTTVYIYLVPAGDGRVFGDHPSRDDHAPRHCRNGPHPYRADRFTTIRELLGERGSRRKRPLLHLILFLFRQFSPSHHKAAFSL